ncbi:SRPBCC family protein [Jatrophihabitans sp. GAS493]|uniref:SRPBCC family protein n=1 Tax=Jatrophihabitans sp. GAS493 TaxID=1907575 RepID=UPI001A7E0820|nr:SRPBCC family protein [Jatrophihabitans sp. GAS493]
MKMGESGTWHARHFGLPFRMMSMITAFERPTRFVDEQTRGPFRFGWHEHTLEAQESGATLMVDRVEFKSSLAPLGTTADRVVLDKYMHNLLRQRNDWLKVALAG